MGASCWTGLSDSSAVAVAFAVSVWSHCGVGSAIGEPPRLPSSPRAPHVHSHHRHFITKPALPPRLSSPHLRHS